MSGARKVALELQRRLSDNGADASLARDSFGGWEIEATHGEATVYITVLHHRLLVVVTGPQGSARKHAVSYEASCLDGAAADALGRLGVILRGES